MGSNKDFRSVITCFLILGLVLAQVLHVEGKSCCRSHSGRDCYTTCSLAGASKYKCASLCHCINVDEDGNCPGGYPHLHNHSDSDTPNAIKFCNVGCRLSVCDNMNIVHHHGEEANVDAELCGSVCARFCNKIAVGTSIAA
ncbi:probable leaf thionin isoform X1 [Lolium rigidum]|uniref:probable leaf thionin isoform X1 n=1 Tax=Lolium rigidum TaxID=89674 RepID=UPI001F5E2710|nr:probable leaf thionin isoform X1 [Lolium rigidum]